MTLSPSPPPLSADELGRYARHIVLPEIGGPGQQRLKGSRVLLVGAGGIGSPAALYLAAAGVGTIGLVDDDHVSLSNLQRQVLFETTDLARPKVEAAAEALGRLNPHVAIEAHPVRLDASNGPALVSRYDVVVDGSDNFATRFLVADLCEAARVPLVTVAVQRFSGSLTTLMPHRPGPDGRLSPRYRDLFPEPPPEGTVPTCAEAGILGVVTGIMGTMGAAEAIKLVADVGDPMVGRLLLVDILRMRFEEIRYRRPADPSP
ncbi:HesA/MoeB/ThiF family protein [Aureimonas phyllosphaerae]|uniref:Molybdopterin-synthase adenylyltransferase n=1 Tax=Aureimonas phyllosphaerae TaxID=1166078 RepID=A0A7W6FWY7_9HYPH|nr:molybdopterin-synthase adenylyltransferase MoeB [Aureimonas phyllosphaerae]MBB3937502.1 molybdopterin/thiamine biosynthesis adenylyltransferase [Aureimonas phyllosphaerae]MBB3961432.1 molybdopterin/thiamine biosynthesis adenylyltransferase [Aureimonas phyllosphaerae]SFF38093.1 Molybdopterin or thiamine biosynthesis adenylyltransferase [Aureimonas phyllosphaerae]